MFLSAQTEPTHSKKSQKQFTLHPNFHSAAFSHFLDMLDPGLLQQMAFHSPIPRLSSSKRGRRAWCLKICLPVTWSIGCWSWCAESPTSPARREATQDYSYKILQKWSFFLPNPKKSRVTEGPTDGRDGWFWWSLSLPSSGSFVSSTCTYLMKIEKKTRETKDEEGGPPNTTTLHDHQWRRMKAPNINNSWRTNHHSKKMDTETWNAKPLWLKPSFHC